MAKPRSRILDFAAYAVVRIGISLIQSLTDRSAQRFADMLGWLAYRIDRRHRQVADENLQHAFPNLDSAQRDRLVRGCFRHFMMLIVEISRLHRKLHVSNWRRYVSLTGGSGVVRAMTSGRPVMIVTAHFGNWELAGYVLGLLGFHTHAIARTLDNPYLDDYMRGFREVTGQRVLAKKGDFDQITDLLKAGGVLATLADQDAGQRGLFVDFFNRPASTHKAIALMAIEYDVTLVVAGTVRVAEPMQYDIVVEEIIEPADYAGRPDAIKAITQRYTSAIERLIQRRPEQYFWLHRRWKHQPLARKAKKAA
jgi:KDO2-lipid IV(A) lauroyltransferase